MGSLIAVAGALWVVVSMWDAFEALVLPRRVTRRLRPTRMFYRLTWRLWSAVARRIRPGGRRETYLSFFGPLSLLVLLAAWAASLVAGFALLQTGLGASLNVPGGGSFSAQLYLSGETFFTLGLGGVAVHLSGAVLRPLALGRPVVVDRARQDPGGEGARGGRHPGCLRAPGESDVRDGAARRRGPGAGARPPADRFVA